MVMNQKPNFLPAIYKNKTGPLLTKLQDSSTNNNPAILSLWHVKGCFIIFGVGIALSIVVFFCEILFKKTGEYLMLRKELIWYQRRGIQF